MQSYNYMSAMTTWRLLYYSFILISNHCNHYKIPCPFNCNIGSGKDKSEYINVYYSVIRNIDYMERLAIMVCIKHIHPKMCKHVIRIIRLRNHHFRLKQHAHHIRIVLIGARLL